MFAELLQDVRTAVRSLKKKPTATAAALGALALGIGANTAIFSVLSGVLLRPLAFPEPDRLVRVVDVYEGGARSTTSPADFADWRVRARSFAHLAALSHSNVNLVGEDGPPERVAGASVTADFHAVVGVPPLLGRGFEPTDYGPGAGNVAVLGHGFWHRRFGADPAILGRTLTLNGEPHTVVGVMAEDFDYPPAAEIWVPLRIEITESLRGSRWLQVIGRLREGVTLEAAQAEMNAVAGRLAREHPETNRGWGVRLYRVKDLMVESIRPVLLVLMGMVAIVLLIACANVASLSLARLAERQGEVAIRSSLGASRSRLLRLFITENLLLALLGAALGWVLAWWGTEVMVAMNAKTIPRADEVGLDLRVLGFTVGVSILVGLLLGTASALQASRTQVQAALKGGGWTQSTASRMRWVRATMVFVQFALAVVLLAAAGLLLRSFLSLQRVAPGFRADHALLADLSLPEGRYGGAAEQRAFYRQLMDRLGDLPGASHAGAIFPIPLGRSRIGFGFAIEGRLGTEPADLSSCNVRYITPGYLQAMGIPLLRGRPFTEADGPSASPVALINQRMAQREWPGEDPLGQRITFHDDPGSDDARWLTIVGIVGDVRHDTLAAEPEIEVYLPMLQTPLSVATLVLRAEGEPERLVAPVRESIAAVDPGLPIYNVRTLEEHVVASMGSERLNTVLSGVFAAVAVLLAAVGVFGVISYTVAQRTRELGVRMALGASRRQVQGLVLRQGMGPVAAGLVLGLGTALLASRVLQQFLFKVEPTDPLTFAVVVLLLAGIAGLASYLPARRATRIEPVVTLRSE